MNEKQKGPEDYNASGEGLGQINCDHSVFKQVAGHAAMKVEGIATIGGRSTLGDLILFREKDSGVEVVTSQEDKDLSLSEVILSLNVTIFFGHNIYEVCTELQRRVKDEIESITSYSVKRVNVHVQGLKMREEPGGAKEGAAGKDTE